MIFVDPFFLFVFLPVTCLAFGLARRWAGPIGALYVLLIASILFYLPWGWDMTAILAGSVIVNFTIGSLLLAQRLAAGVRKLLLAAGECLNFGALIGFKYHFFANLLTVSSTSPADWVIPAGISFYTFHQAAFLADAYGREASVVAMIGEARSLWQRGRALARYAAFVTFFPQLVIGPITYMHEFQPQVDRPQFGKARYVDVAVGFSMIAIGIFKKIVLADHLNDPANAAFDSATGGAAMHPTTALIGILAYYLQLYFDFSGYSDAALGIARIFGLRYPVNFFSPLKAVGIIDYYRRWHMTLTRVISRFLFSPLSVMGTRLASRRRMKGVPARILGMWIPLAINFEVIALWHAARWTLILFGAIHGTWYIVETEVRRSKRWKRWRQRAPARLRATIGRILIFAMLPLTFALFRSSSPSACWFLLTQLFVGHGAPVPIGYVEKVALGLAIVYLLPNSVELMQRYRPAILTYVNESYGPKSLQFRWRPNLPWMAAIVALGAAGIYYLILTQAMAPFLYQGF